MEGFKQKVSNLIAKLKTIKNIEIIVGVVIICIVALIYSNVSANNKKASTNDNTVNAAYTAVGITEGIEERLANILSNINGAGTVKVMVTFASSPELVTASTTNIHTNKSDSSSTTTETNTPIVVTNNGTSELIILKEMMPEVMGVIIVAEGATTAKVRSELLKATKTILNVNANVVEIFAMK